MLGEGEALDCEAAGGLGLDADGVCLDIRAWEGAQSLRGSIWCSGFSASTAPSPGGAFPTKASVLSVTSKADFSSRRWRDNNTISPVDLCWGVDGPGRVDSTDSGLSLLFLLCDAHPAFSLEGDVCTKVAEDLAEGKGLSLRDGSFCRDKVRVDGPFLLCLLLGISDPLLDLRPWRLLFGFLKANVSGEDSGTVPCVAIFWAIWQEMISGPTAVVKGPRGRDDKGGGIPKQ